MNDLALFDLDETVEPSDEPIAQPALRPVWSHVTCHTCGQPLKRFVRQEGTWYRYELDHTAWDHLRAHENGHLLLRLMPYSVGSTNGAQTIRAAA